MITLQCPSCKAECGFQRPDSLPETLVSFNRTWYNELRQDREPYTHEILNGKIAFTKSEADIYLCATYEMVADTILDCTLLVDYDGTNEADKNHIFAEVHRQIADFLLSEKLCTTPLELKEDIKVLVSYLFSNNEKYGFAAKEYTDEDLVVYMAKCHGLTIAQDPSLSAVERRKNWKLQAKIWTSFSILFVDLVTRRHLQRFKVAEDGTY